MKNLNFILIATVACSLLLSSCKGSDGPSLSGDLVGFAYLVNSSGVRQPDNSGIRVSVDGINCADTTNVDGKFILPNLLTGIYNITMTKNGYPSKKLVSIQFVGGGQGFLGTYAMGETPNCSVTSLTATSSAGMVTISGTLSSSLPAYKYVRIFFGTNSQVSSDPSKYFNMYTTSSTGSSTTFSYAISSINFTNMGVVLGQTIYAKAYVDNYYASSSYIDYATGRYTYTTMNAIPSNTVSVAVQ